MGRLDIFQGILATMGRTAKNVFTLRLSPLDFKDNYTSDFGLEKCVSHLLECQHAYNKS